MTERVDSTHGKLTAPINQLQSTATMITVYSGEQTVNGLTWVDHNKAPNQPNPKTGKTPGLDAKRRSFMAEVSKHPLQALGETTLRNLDEVGNR